MEAENTPQDPAVSPPETESQSEPTTPSPVAETAQKIDLKTMLPFIFGGALALLVVGVGSFSLGVANGRAQVKTVTKVVPVTPSPKPPQPTKAFSHSANPMTVNWNIYDNTGVGFSLKYPPRYGKPQIMNESGVGVEYATGREENGGLLFGIESPDTFSLSLIPITGTLAEFVKTQLPTATDSGILKKDLTVAGTKAEWYTIKSSPEEVKNPQKIYFTFNDYGFILEAPESYSPRDIEYILSSFSP
jgi:hypothetical protein